MFSVNTIPPKSSKRRDTNICMYNDYLRAVISLTRGNRGAGNQSNPSFLIPFVLFCNEISHWTVYNNL